MTRTTTSRVEPKAGRQPRAPVRRRGESMAKAEGRLGRDVTADEGRATEKRADIFVTAKSATHQPMGGEGSVPVEQCPDKCSYRCSATSHRKPCMSFCIQCCTKCLCVPSGTYGHKEECPCYNNWKTKEGKPKCP
ncbi:gibberellin-regulated protein 5-like [Elaeis guineensis]|uniref:Gibberellin-regulated protein 5-like n=1 Tax=Elaeis guineensis var. tenera TaxID=51953 RepID=A0A8N4F062_ELAGV|nr:gibberellin-regulated protein 5-like [Elaeis guineensis]